VAAATPECPKLKLIAEYDPMLRNHLTCAQAHRCAVVYLFPTVRNQFNGIIAENVRCKLPRSIKRNKWYGIIFNTTPGGSHREQMSRIIRYVDVGFVTKLVEVRESYSGFIQVHSKGANSNVDWIAHMLKRHMLPVVDC